jgi:probable lipoprotein NlpC
MDLFSGLYRRFPVKGKAKAMFAGRFLSFAALIFVGAASAYAVPLESGFSLAPGVYASQEEKMRAFEDARNRVIAAAAQYERTPYRYGGIDRSGLDCSGLVYVSFKDALGVSPPRSTTGLYTWAENIPFEKAQAGDLLFFKTDNSGRISHVAIYIGNNRFIHSASEGPQTGVIYSSFSEQYWASAYAGTGRALPEVRQGFNPVPANVAAANNPAISQTSARPAPQAPSGDGKTTISVGLAPTWGGFFEGADPVRGFASHIRIGRTAYLFGRDVNFGLELRPEYDAALGVFRIPLTVSFGKSDQFLVFAGPVLSIGDASLSTQSGERHYSGGTSWLGAVGITVAPLVFPTAAGDFAVYIEAAWQYYVNNSEELNLNADFSAGFRLSTGLRWSYKLK